jgi:hypothetical protein
VWEESRERQAAALGRATFDPGALGQLLAGVSHAIVRPAAGIAHLPSPVPDETSAAVRALQDRVRARFDPQAVLA